MSSQAINTTRITTAETGPATPAFWPRDLVSVRDLSPQEVRAVLDLASLIKQRPADFRGALAGKQMALFF